MPTMDSTTPRLNQGEEIHGAGTKDVVLSGV